MIRSGDLVRRLGGGKKASELTDDGWRLLHFWNERLRAEQEGFARFFERFQLAERERQSQL